MAIELGLSGRLLMVHSVKLFHAKAVQLLDEISANAQLRMKPNISPISFIGTPSWALSGVLATGLLQKFFDKSDQTIAEKLFSEAANLLIEMRDRAEFIAFSEISGRDQPNPPQWSCRQSTRIDGVTRTVFFIPLIEEFYEFKGTDGANYHIRWKSVDSYRMVHE